MLDACLGNEGFRDGAFHPCALWERSLAGWESSRRAAITVGDERSRIERRVDSDAAHVNLGQVKIHHHPFHRAVARGRIDSPIWRRPRGGQLPQDVHQLFQKLWGACPARVFDRTDVEIENFCTKFLISGPNKSS